MNFYKDLFDPHNASNFSLDEEVINDIPQVLEAKNEVLTKPFSEREVRNAIFQMKHNKASGPDGFPAKFYQNLWEIIKTDLLQLFFEEFYSGNLPIHNLNFGVITLLPKKSNARKIQQYRSICLLNITFKIFAEVLTNRLYLVADKVIRPPQTAFIPGWFIMKGLVVLHENLHELHKKKTKSVVLIKLDFEKAYDKVKWIEKVVSKESVKN